MWKYAGTVGARCESATSSGMPLAESAPPSTQALLPIARPERPAARRRGSGASMPERLAVIPGPASSGIPDP